MVQETEKKEKTITKIITVKEKPVRRDLNLEGLPVTEHHIYPKGTTDENGALKSDYVEIGTEESLRLELTPAKVVFQFVCPQLCNFRDTLQN